MAGKTKKPSKYYEYKINWVEITPKLKKEMFGKLLPCREYAEMGKKDGYSFETFRKIFLNPPAKINKKIVDAIREHLGLPPLGKEYEGITLQNLNNGSKKIEPVTNKKPATNYTIDNRKKPFMSDAMKKRAGLSK